MKTEVFPKGIEASEISILDIESSSDLFHVPILSCILIAECHPNRWVVLDSRSPRHLLRVRVSIWNKSHRDCGVIIDRKSVV